jgi:hypothetical protein
MFYEMTLKNIKAFYTSLILLLVIYLLIILNILNSRDNSIDTTYNSSLEKNINNILDEHETLTNLIFKKFHISDLNFSQSYTTVVSLYFPLQKSKHSLGEYSIWTRNALLSIEAPLVLFTTLEVKQAFIKIRPNNTLFFVYENHWTLLKEIEEYRNMNYTDNYRHKQHLIDPHKHIHVND